MEEVYSLNERENAEIKFQWIRLGLRCHWDEAVTLAVEMVTEHGRMRYIRPIYRYTYVSLVIPFNSMYSSCPWENILTLWQYLKSRLLRIDNKTSLI